MQATEPTWTDQRMDEFAERTEENFREVRVEIRDVRSDLRAEIHQSRSELRAEIQQLDDTIDRTRNDLRKEIDRTRNELRTEIREVETVLKGEFKVLRAEMNTRLNGIDRKFDILFGAMATGLAAAVVQHFIG